MSLYSCSNSLQQGRYYQYYVGTMKIEKPILVEFENQNDTWYVSPDSALYCCNDSSWLCRNDVFPYLPIVEFNPLLPTYFPRKELRHLAYFQWNYIPFYESDRINHHTIYRFYYDINTFECYMQETNGWLDQDDIDVVEIDNASYDFQKREKKYRMVVRQKYNILQILRLKRVYKDYFDSDQ